MRTQLHSLLNVVGAEHTEIFQVTDQTSKITTLDQLSLNPLPNTSMFNVQEKDKGK